MKIGKWEVLIRKISDRENIDFFDVNFAKRYIKKHKFTVKKYWEGRIPYIKELRQAHFSKYGRNAGLRVTKEFLNIIFAIPQNFNKCQGCIHESKDVYTGRCYCLRMGASVFFEDVFLCEQKEISTMGLLEIGGK